MTQPDRSFDLLILGAGPAGSAAAITARRAGLSVALIDKARFPRDKLCGGLITGRCAAHLWDIFGLDVDADRLFERREAFEFYMDGQCLARMEQVPPAWLTMRRAFDAELLHRALRAGAVDLTGERVQALDLDGHSLTLGSGARLGYSALIGADGVQSNVARALFGAPFEPAQIGFALEVEAPGDAPSPATPIRVDFAAASWGYGWSFPKAASTTIGIGGLKTRNPDMKAALARYRGLLGEGSEVKIKGHHLPFGGYRSRPGRGCVLLAGDAAGFVDPITGEGLGHAIHSGAMAAQAVAEAIGAGHPAGAHARYRAATRPIRTALFCARMLRPLIFAAPLQPFFASTFRASRSLKHEYLALLAGQTDYPALLGRTLTRLPRAALRHLMRRGKPRVARQG